jgi:hypothetical protein
LLNSQNFSWSSKSTKACGRMATARPSISAAQRGPDCGCSADEVRATPVQQALQEILSLPVRQINDEIARIRTSCGSLTDGSLSSRESEEAVRNFGSALGFVATRPDNEIGRGPDVLWEDADKKIIIPLELKTDKKSPAT